MDTSNKSVVDDGEDNESGVNESEGKQETVEEAVGGEAGEEENGSYVAENPECSHRRLCKRNRKSRSCLH